MQRRIEAHKAHRDPAWNLVEEPVTLAAVLAEHATPYRCLLVDCLTLWLTNLLGTEDDTVLRQEIEALKASFSSLPGEIILVSNEINMGVIPLGALTRRFCDELGVLHQLLAAECDRVVLMVAGLPLLLKGG
jgi:adenosylcobinamide kinase/adenosylcobinamide-phosphate guanylyltransferase